MKQLTADVLFCASCLVTLALHVISLNFAPWMDEVHIVEMGRLAFGAHTESILTNADGSFFIPLYYLGPCIHELAFRLAGPSGVRALPMLMLVLAATLFRKWLRGNNLFRESTTLILSLCLLWMPLFIQSTRLVRIDSAIMAATFGILVLIDTPAAVGNRVRLSAAAVLAAVSPFLWPSAILLFPLYAERHISRSIEARRPTSALLAESYTLYGLLRNLSLARAKKEQHVTQPSFLARIGEAFAYDELPSAARAKIVDRLQKNGFSMSAETSEIWERQVETHQ